jgi:hypothetical protein
MGEETFGERRKQGWAMTFEQAVEYALDVDEASSAQVVSGTSGRKVP